MRLINHRGCQKEQHRNQKRCFCRKSMGLQPVVHQQNRCQKTQNTDCHKIIAHFYKRQQIRGPDQGTIQPIIGKMIDILSSSQSCCKFREEPPRIVKLLSKIIWYHTVLAAPVSPGCKQSIAPRKTPDCQKNNCRQKNICLIFYLHGKYAS